MAYLVNTNKLFTYTISSSDEGAMNPPLSSEGTSAGIVNSAMSQSNAVALGIMKDVETADTRMVRTSSSALIKWSQKMYFNNNYDIVSRFGSSADSTAPYSIQLE